MQSDDHEATMIQHSGRIRGMVVWGRLHVRGFDNQLGQYGIKFDLTGFNQNQWVFRSV